MGHAMAGNFCWRVKIFNVNLHLEKWMGYYYRKEYNSINPFMGNL